MNTVAALVISLALPVGFVIGIRGLDLYGTGKSRDTVHAVAWGMIASTIAVAVQSGIVMDGWITGLQLKRAVAPVSEELLKAGILLYLVSRADFNYAVDGAIHGFGAGIGFAIVENFIYILTSPESALGLAAARVSSASLIHASASGFVGSALAASLIESGARRWVYILTGLTFAIGIHMGYNNLIAVNNPSVAQASFAGLLGVGLIVLIIRLSLDIERGWILEKLGMTDRVTRGEAAIVHRIENMDEVLEPIARRFGREKAALTESLLYLQAGIGIKRKLVEMTADPDRRTLIENQVKQRIVEMDAVRKRIGPYCMLFVRSVYVSSGAKLWELIDQRVSESDPSERGGGIWSKLEARIKSSRPEDEDS